MSNPPVMPALPDDDETARRSRLLSRVLIAMMALGVLLLGGALLDSRNKVTVGLWFYGTTLPFLAVLLWVLRRGHVTVVAWAVSLSFWALIAFVLLFFGGLKGHNGATFAVSVVLIGSLVGSRPALALALASTGWAGVVAILEEQGRLPPQLGPYTPYNALSALGFTLLMTTLLVQSSLGSLRALHARAAESARARDEALQRSIHAQKMELVGNLTSGIAHDFNNLLTVIANAAALLRGARTTEPERASLLDDLDAATLRATLITRQLLSFGKAEGTLQPVDLAAAVRALEPMLPRLLGAGITVVAHAPARVPVQATRSGLEQILLNLSVNARDAMPTGGTLTLRAERDAGEARLTVTDTGIGMDSETTARAFDAFFTTKPTGTGVGLATVRTLVERFGGSVTAHSAPGAGATFVVRLPELAEAPRVVPESPTRAPSETAPPGQPRVLVVEDDALVRRATTRLLERNGHDVVAVANGVEALALLERSRDFAVVVSDVVMPQLDGEELARRVAILYPSLPVVLMSGNRQPAADVLAAPGRAFVEKPATVEELLGAIRQVRGQP